MGLTLTDHRIWVDALCQVFFSLGTCMGIFAVYGSYRDSKQPVIRYAVIVSLFDTLVSFLCGFIVWGLLGFLDKNGGNLKVDEVEGTGLMFVAIPRALDMVGGSGWWTFIFMLLFTLLGFTTSVSFTEVTTTTINDIAFLKGLPR